MTVKLIYQILVKPLSWMALHARSDNAKEIEILVPRHQLAVLQRRTPRPRLSWSDRAVIAALTPTAPCSSPLRIPRRTVHDPALTPPARPPPVDHPGHPLCYAPARASKRCAVIAASSAPSVK